MHAEGPWVLHSEAQAAIDAATKRAEDAELLLKLVQSQKAITDQALAAGIKHRDEWVARAVAAEKERDEQAAALRIFGLCLKNAMDTMRYCQERTCRCNSAANPCPRCRFSSSLGWIDWKLENNPIAAAAVKEAGK
jgi:hypothetical protein